MIVSVTENTSVTHPDCVTIHRTQTSLLAEPHPVAPVDDRKPFRPLRLVAQDAGLSVQKR